VVNASITGDDLGQGARWGAVGAAASIAACYGVGQVNIGNPYVQFGVSMAAGVLVSGGISSLAGGDFVQGLQNVAVGVAAGYFTSMGMSRILRQSPVNASPEEVGEKTTIDMQVSYETPEDMYGRIELAGAKGEGEWHFDPNDHGKKPHFQRTVSGRELRYDAKTLEPIPHKGFTPPDLSKSAAKGLMKDSVWKQAVKWFSRGVKMGGVALGIVLELASPAEAH
jgi:hypothetical protein